MKFPSPSDDFLAARQKWNAFWINNLRRKIVRAFPEGSSDRVALSRRLTEAAEVALYGQIADLLDDDDYEDPQDTGCEVDEERRATRLALSERVNYPRARADEEVSRLFCDRPDEHIAAVKRDIKRFLGQDSLRIRLSKFRDFVLAMNQNDSAWGRYALMLQGHGVSPDDDADIEQFLQDNKITLGRTSYSDDLAYDQASVLTEQLIDEWN
jgi:hypothetical protein